MRADCRLPVTRYKRTDYFYFPTAPTFMFYVFICSCVKLLRFSSGFIQYRLKEIKITTNLPSVRLLFLISHYIRFIA